MKKKIIVITTGGTIGSILQTDSVSVDITEKRISHEIDRAKNRLGYTVEVMSPINKNSEALYPADWGKILTCINEANNSDADGIVITHGTDTMAYSVAAAISYNEHWNKKICFTGAYYSPDHPSSDTSLSLLAALEFAASQHPANGIYIAFRSNIYNSEARIIHGADVKPMVFDDQFFESAYGDVVSTFSPKEGMSEEISLNSNKSPSLGSSLIPAEKDIVNAQHEIACISLYPGIDKQFLESSAKGRKVLVIQMYHSGTGPADCDNSDLVEFIRSTSKDTIILMGTFPKKYINVPYDSTKEIKKAGAFIYSDLQQHFLYVFALLALSTGISPRDITNKLARWEI